MQFESQPTPSRPEKERPRAVRTWIIGALFVWALTGAVAFAAFSSSGASNSPAPTVALVPEVETEVKAPALEPATALAPVVKKPRSAANPKSIQWEETFEGAMQRARLENKPIMIDFYTDWCGVCKMLDREVLPVKNVVAESRNWVSIKIDAEKRPDVAAAYGVTGYPTLVFAEKSGKPLSILPGFAPAPEFVNIMQEARAKLKPSV